MATLKVLFAAYGALAGGNESEAQAYNVTAQLQDLKIVRVVLKGVLWGMYITPEARGSGLAAALVDTLLEYARKEVEQVQLTVAGTNPRARRFYQRIGFVEYGLEERALKYKGAYHDEVLMVKKFYHF
jgi:ribosomal protein S18 acetylase RimI-like enzyme